MGCLRAAERGTLEETASLQLQTVVSGHFERVSLQYLNAGALVASQENGRLSQGRFSQERTKPGHGAPRRRG